MKLIRTTRSKSWDCRTQDMGRMAEVVMGMWVLVGLRREGGGVGRGRGSWIAGTMRRCMEQRLVEVGVEAG